MDSSGRIIGKYRKRNLTSNENGNAGTEIYYHKIMELGISLSILICYDIEDDNILAEVMRQEPDIILNPVHIPCRSSYVQQHPESTWLVALPSTIRTARKESGKPDDEATFLSSEYGHE